MEDFLAPNEIWKALFSGDMNVEQACEALHETSACCQRLANLLAPSSPRVSINEVCEIYHVNLLSIDEERKIPCIKILREFFHIGLKQAKELVDNVPCRLGICKTRTDAERLERELADQGATVELIRLSA